MQDAIHFVVPLYCDHNEFKDGVGENTIYRLQEAMAYAGELYAKDQKVCLLLPAGHDPKLPAHRRQTAAEWQADWAYEQEAPFQLIINRVGGIPFDTLGEVEWTMRTVREWVTRSNTPYNAGQWNDQSRATITFVSNERHLKRIKFMLRHFTNSLLPDGFEGDLDERGLPRRIAPQVTSHPSLDKPPTWIHEFLGYTKLMLIKHGWIKRE